MIRKNYKSDFEFLLRIKSFGPETVEVDGDNTRVLFPSYDFTGILSTGGGKTFTFSRVGDRFVNCSRDGELLRVVLNNHGLEIGQMTLEWNARIPNTSFRDGYEDIAPKFKLPIELVRCAGDCECTPAEVIDVLMPLAMVTAYETAVQYGYTGTREEYEAALGDMPHAVSAAREAESRADAAAGRATEAAIGVEAAIKATNEATEESIAATNNANTATANANAAASAAEQATEEAHQATLDAQYATSAATNAAASVNTATENADTATENANAATSAANTATSNANSATDRATNAAIGVEAAIRATNIATENAIAATDRANTATENANTATDNANAATSAAQSATDETKQATEDAKQVTEEAKEALDQLQPYVEDGVSYGIEFDTSVSSPTCTRIGNPTLHRTLPIQNRMKGCTLADSGAVNEYLNPADWRGQTRDGSRGQVMVELPMYYRKFETSGTKCRVRISEYPLPGYHQVRRKYVSAYEAALQRSTLTLASVVNDTADYRGGNNNATYDGTYRTLLGRPATAISRTNFRNYARKRKAGSTEWNCMTYDIQKDLFWLFAIEYATLNAQLPFNAELTAEGYHQGGLGAGVTTLTSAEWSAYNGYYPFVPCGCTDELGNGSGEIAYDIPNAEGGTLKTVMVNRYRCVEIPFGHTYKWTDGINVRISPNTDAGGDGLSKVFVTDNPALFNDTNYNGYSYVGNEARTDGYVKRIIFGEFGEIMPAEVGAGSTTYFCDYHYTHILTAETLHGVLFGGNANIGAGCGFACANSKNNTPSIAAASVGSRLCFIPAA